MAHPSYDPDCGVCRKLHAEGAAAPLFENALWQVRATDAPTGVGGWMVLYTNRHAAGPAVFSDAEAASFGPTLRHLQARLLTLTGALRIYMAAMGESSPHFHCHLVPRYAAMPKDAKAWGVFDLQRAAAAGEIQSDEVEAQRLAREYAALLVNEPPPA